MSAKRHEHKWQMTMHLDGCHWYESHYKCTRCSATAHTWDEREVRKDSYSMVWMDPEGQEEPCERCAELLSGAKPKHVREVPA